MNKAEFVDAVAEKAGIPRSHAGKLVNAVIETVTETLVKGEPVVLTGFGSFEVRQRAARNGRNPMTGAVVQIPESKVPAFKASKTLKDVIAS